MPADPLSDKALAVFAFAAYHQLTTGTRVVEIVRDDAAGHHADAEAVDELRRHGLVEAGDDRFRFTSRGEAVVGRIIDAMRSRIVGSENDS